MELSQTICWLNTKAENGENLKLCRMVIAFSPRYDDFTLRTSLLERMKAYKDKDDQVFLFRPEKNFERNQQICKRLAIQNFLENLH